MAIKKTYYEDGGIEYDISGVFTDNVLSELNKELYQDEEQIKQISYQILNVSNIEGIEITDEQILRNAEEDKRAFSINPKMRIAILVNSDLAFGLSRVWEANAYNMFAQNDNCGVFRNRNELIDWIKSEGNSFCIHLSNA